MRILTLFFCIPFISSFAQNEWMHENEFVYVDEFLRHAQYEVRYHSSNNFVGDTIEGYKTDRVVLTSQAAKALQKAEFLLKKQGYCLKIFDTYRPQRAVDHFKLWATDISDTITRHQFYPNQDKRELFDLGYISKRSGHSRGSTIDLTIVDMDSNLEVDMGSPYDFFGEISHHGAEGLSTQQNQNRMTLKKAMLAAGFRSYSKEWWHYTLNNEPYPDTYFNFVVNSGK